MFCFLWWHSWSSPINWSSFFFQGLEETWRAVALIWPTAGVLTSQKGAGKGGLWDICDGGQDEVPFYQSYWYRLLDRKINGLRISLVHSMSFTLSFSFYSLMKNVKHVIIVLVFIYFYFVIVLSLSWKTGQRIFFVIVFIDEINTALVCGLSSDLLITDQLLLILFRAYRENKVRSWLYLCCCLTSDPVSLWEPTWPFTA